MIPAYLKDAIRYLTAAESKYPHSGITYARQLLQRETEGDRAGTLLGRAVRGMCEALADLPPEGASLACTPGDDGREATKYVRWALRSLVTRS